MTLLEEYRHIKRWLQFKYWMKTCIYGCEQKQGFCWLIKQAAVPLNRRNCGFLSCSVAGTPVFAFDRCQKKLGLMQLSASWMQQQCKQRSVDTWGKRAGRRSGQENKTKRERVCFRAIHQIPSHYSKPRYLHSFHTSFIKLCGFGCLHPDGVSPSLLSIWRGSQARVRQQA